jgi:hypothetical protein
MLRLASEGLRSVGATSPSKSACSILPLARRWRAGGLSRVNPRPVVRRYCPWPRFVDGPPSSAALALRPSALRRSVGDASMTIPGGTGTL